MDQFEERRGLEMEKWRDRLLFWRRMTLKIAVVTKDKRSSDIVVQVIFDFLGIYCHYADVKIKKISIYVRL